MSLELIIHILKLWYKKLSFLQVSAMLLALILLILAYFPWVQVNPPENIGKWLKYFPIEIVRKYSGFEIAGLSCWMPISFIVILALPTYKKFLIGFILGAVYFMYSSADAFSKEMKSSVPLYEYISEYLIDYSFLWPVYSYAVIMILLFVYAIYLLFKK